ncbi:hypothetical protein K1719_036880 [Acacia pycnantha]|nr:hypothetical protein K1719_036880 [Acacia pycnantha]
MTGSGGNAASSSSSSSESTDMSTSGLHVKHQQELEVLTLTTQPFRTLKFFTLAVIEFMNKTILYLLAKGGWLLLLSAFVGAFGIVLMTIDGPHEKHIEELLKYFQFGLWWIALGVASSIGFGSGLHTFVLYLGPHIAFFTIKAMQCGRVDLKSAPYDTIQLKSGPSWLDKDCSEFGPPLFQTEHGSRVPLSWILPQVQMEAILWGAGTAIGELPPYFISRAARESGRAHAMKELDTKKKGILATLLNKIKRWFLSHSQHLNFPSILVLASVPNPLFDLAGIMCGEFGVSFWKFFLPTLIGKAIIKTHIQTVFIILICNNQLLDWIENEFIRVVSHIPGLASILPDVITKLKALRDKYMKAPHEVSPQKIQGRKWNFSFALIWNTVVWLMLLNYFIKIVNSTAQGYLKKQQDQELHDFTGKSAPTSSDVQ